MGERTTGTLPEDNRQTGTLASDRQTGTLPIDRQTGTLPIDCLLYTSDAADEL